LICTTQISSGRSGRSVNSRTGGGDQIVVRQALALEDHAVALHHLGRADQQLRARARRRVRGQAVEIEVCLQQRAQLRLARWIVEVRAHLDGDRRPRPLHRPEVPDRVDDVVHLEIAPEREQPPRRLVGAARDQAPPDQRRTHRAARRSAQGEQLEAPALRRLEQPRQDTGREGGMAAAPLQGDRYFGCGCDAVPMRPRSRPRNCRRHPIREAETRG
jgi:hypothetical protein